MLHEEFEINREKVVEAVVARCFEMVEESAPGALEHSDRAALRERIMRSGGFDSAVDRWVAAERERIANRIATAAEVASSAVLAAQRKKD